MKNMKCYIAKVKCTDGKIHTLLLAENSPEEVVSTILNRPASQWAPGFKPTEVISVERDPDDM